MAPGFTVSLAGIPIHVTPLCPEIYNFFSGFISEEAPVFSIATTEKDLEKERIFADRTYKGTRTPGTPWPKRYLETIFLLRAIAAKIYAYDVLLFHGSAVAFEEKAYLFAAPSGTGKTTHMQLWLDQLPGAYVLNGDKPFLRLLPDGQVLACGGPWKGKEKLGGNIILPLEAVCLLERSEENWITPVLPQEAMDRMLRQTHLPEEPVAMIRTLQLLDRITGKVRLFRLGCNMEPEAAQTSIRAMIPQ